jgi:hypothetical protein
MKAAPEAGYQSSFDVTNDDYAKFREGARVCFYFKLNGLYGKGELWSVRYLEETGLDIRIRFRLQPNGTRNVETRE